MNLSRAHQAAVRKLAALAYERELRRALSELRGEFDAWQSGSVSTHQLADRVHAFHDGAARDLYQRYHVGNTRAAVAHALATDILTDADVPKAVRASLESLVDFFRRDD